MELPQPRPFATQGSKPTHEFLALYSPSQQDPTLTPPGGCLKTHDFLQPLEQVRNKVAKEGKKVEVAAAPTTMVEHNLPGGIGTYSISHISYINQTPRLPKPEGITTAAQSSSSDKNDDNSNCSSYTGSGFTLWEESAANKGKTGKENITGNSHVIREGAMKIGGVPWMPSQSSSIHNHPTTTISSLSSSHLPAQKNQSFVDMLKSAKFTQEDEDDEEEEFVIKKEPSSYHKGIMSVKVDTSNPDQKPNTPRSKHSATEQRRRSKINDRFSMLRELIPHGDQKRDKASFLLEVIEYIQFLQEKVHTYEDSNRGWNNELPWNSQKPTTDQSLLPNSISRPPSLFTPKIDENSSAVAPNTFINCQNLLDSDTSSLDAINQHPLLTNKTSPFATAFHPNVHGRTRQASDTSNMASQPLPQPWQSNITTDKLKDQELIIESGTISISTIYSQGLLSTLTQALQSSGVDLSHANISVQIDLGKRANPTTLNSSSPVIKKPEVPSMDQSLARSRPASIRKEESDKAFKRLKTKA